jgi:hypothetical protein
MKVCIACSHVGQMLFAGNKYLLLKRITVHQKVRRHNLHGEVTLQEGEDNINRLGGWNSTGNGLY